MKLQKQMIDYAPFVLDHAGDLKGQEILVVGDVGLDEYVLGQVKRISPEAPVPVVEVDTEEARLGLAANVAQNIASLGGIARLVGVVGKDATANQLGSLLSQAGVSPEHLVVDSTRSTTRKLRVMVQRHHIVRIDYEHRQFVSPDVEAEIVKQVTKLAPTASAIVIQDYAKGVVSETLVKEIVRIGRAHGKKVLVDPHRATPVETYRGVDLIKANFDESVALTGMSVDGLRKDLELIDKVGRKLMETVGSKEAVVTLGKEGMRIFENGKSINLPTNAKQVFDVTGAGDTVIAAIALAWGAGFTLEQSCALANFAAGVVVGKIGCVPCTVEELIEAASDIQCLADA